MNTVEAQDDRFQILPLEGEEYSEVRIEQQDRVPWSTEKDAVDGGMQLLHKVSFKMDPERTVYRRSVYTLFDLISLVGGLICILYVSGSALVSCCLAK